MMQRGFTLVELSIVLVILGLLVGGVLGGQSLIKASTMRSIVAEKEEYTAAIAAFRQKYEWLPGDFPKATKIWPAAHATPATCRQTLRTQKSTCDGNGDEDIGSFWDTESDLAWEQMSLAGLVSGNYVGWNSITNPGSAYAHNTVGQSSPRSKIKGGGWAIGSKAIINAWAYDGTYGDPYYQGNYNHQLILAGHIETQADMDILPGRNILTAKDALSIDSKIDNGKPGTGIVRTINYSWPTGCVSDIARTAAQTAEYTPSASSSVPVCRLMFDIGF